MLGLDFVRFLIVRQRLFSDVVKLFFSKCLVHSIAFVGVDELFDFFRNLN